MLASATAVIVATVAMVAGLSGTSSAQTLPDPHTFVSNLDLECWQTVPYTPAFPPILTHHLNPVLSGLPDEKVTLGARQQLCSPVAKNGVIPPSSVLPFIQYIDLKCYAITPPASVNVPLTLSQLDPVLASMPTQKVTMQNNRQLCVPVQKNNQAIPANVLNIVRWIDLEKYDLTPSTPVSPFALALNHINPLLVTLPTEQTSLTQPLQLAVPVAKNGAIPPSS